MKASIAWPSAEGQIWVGTIGPEDKKQRLSTKPMLMCYDEQGKGL
eukprot:gene4806-1127_t